MTQAIVTIVVVGSLFGNAVLATVYAVQDDYTKASWHGMVVCATLLTIVLGTLSRMRMDMQEQQARTSVVIPESMYGTACEECGLFGGEHADDCPLVEDARNGRR